MNIIPFRGYRYNLNKIGKMDDVICPPYDQFKKGLDEFLFARHPYNLARIIVNKIEPEDSEENNRYSRSKALLDQWLSEGIFIQDARPSIYPYYQDYCLSDGTSKTRKGFIALGEVSDYSDRIVLPHEKTLTKPKEDRLRLMRSTCADTGLIFMLYSDPAGEIEKLLDLQTLGPSLLKALDLNQENNRIWRIDDCESVKSIMDLLEHKTVIIADGHHRYEVARQFRDEAEEKVSQNPAWVLYRYKLMSFIRLESEGITIFPIHRLIHSIHGFDEPLLLERLKKFFEISPFMIPAGDEEAGVLRLTRRMHDLQLQDENVFGLYLPQSRSFHCLRLRQDQALKIPWPADKSQAWRKLDVSVLQEIILSRVLGIGEKELSDQTNLEYVSFCQEAVKKADAEKYQCLFLMNPTLIDQVKRVVEAGDLLPQKSTHFHPKLMEGLVFAKHV
jgi:uncharacterized protein (DUF1015 family)